LRITTSIRTACLVCAGTPFATAQDFNVDVGQPGTAPPSSYAAAGLPGVWNSLLGTAAAPALPTFGLIAMTAAFLLLGSRAPRRQQTATAA
jgi:hypothetical protein